MKKKFGFVVLNYKNFEETLACVESILAIEGNYFIVVVDNDSPNDSFRVLSERYAPNEKVSVIASGKNGGYSFGNNCGIQFLEKIGIRDVIIATSDTLVVSLDILDQLEQMDSSDIGVIGPSIQNLEGDSQNPMLVSINISYILNIHFPSIAAAMRNLVYTAKKSLRQAVSERKDSARRAASYGEVFMVHGSFLFVSRHYFEKCGYLDEQLFMYGEEDLLAYQCCRNGLRMLYQPAIKVIHKDARSTPMENNNSFTTSNSMKSLRYLRQQMSLPALLIHLVRHGKLL